MYGYVLRSVLYDVKKGEKGLLVRDGCDCPRISIPVNLNRKSIP